MCGFLLKASFKLNKVIKHISHLSLLPSLFNKSVKVLCHRYTIAAEGAANIRASNHASSAYIKLSTVTEHFEARGRILLGF